MPKDRLGKNIRILRNIFGETQLDLSLAIGLDSPNAISNYENGTRYPLPDKRKKIASHFRITEDELMNYKFSFYNYTSSKLVDAKTLANITVAMFPIISTEKAMSNELFKKAFFSHMRLLDSLRNGQEFDDFDLDNCCEAYTELCVSHDLPEATVNALGLLMIVAVIIKSAGLIVNFDSFSKEKIEIGDFLKKFYLRDCTISEEEYVLEESAQEDLNNFQEGITYLIKKLKKNVKYSDLVYYYLALSYIYGVQNNDLSDEMSKHIGFEMMFTYKSIGNKYAKKFFLNITEILCE